MNLQATISLMADVGSGIEPKAKHHAVISPHMKEDGGHARPKLKKVSVKHSGGHKSGVHHGVKGKTLPVTHPHVHLVHLRIKQGIKSEANTTLAPDSSASDVANHHSWQEPSATDPTITNWRAKRRLEKMYKRRNLELFEAAAETGPCGCTLKIGERVTVEGIGRGRIRSRRDRMLTVALDNGKNRIVDQKFVHRMASARR